MGTVLDLPVDGAQVEDSAKRHEEATAQFNSLAHADVLERATRRGEVPSVRVRDLAHALESIGVS